MKNRIIGKSGHRVIAQTDERTIRDFEVMTLCDEASQVFVEALMNPPEPNQVLRATAERYRKLVKEPSWSKKS